jgi:uncharacterized surface protein with fasciclin (FAS1) repeats
MSAGLGPIATVTAIGTLGAGQGTIMEVLQADGRFTKFVQALQLTNLDDQLNSDTQTYTVFAPTDSAFDQLPAGSFESLSANPQGQLLQILQYHIATPGLQVDGLQNIGSITTLQGGRLTITTIGAAGVTGTATTAAAAATTTANETMTTSAAETTTADNVTAVTTTATTGATLRVDDAQIIDSDILASNGVIQAIDTVLMPTISSTGVTSTVTPETTSTQVTATTTNTTTTS